MAAKVKSEATNKIMLELLIVNGCIVVIRIFLFKKNSLQPNSETRSRLYINLYIMGRPFSMYIIISMHTQICKKCPKGIGKTRNLFFCFHY